MHMCESINIGTGAFYASKSLYFFCKIVSFVLKLYSMLHVSLLTHRYAAYVFSGYKSDLNWNCNAVLKYTNPCKGCSRCYSEESYNETMHKNRRWWHAFLPRKQPLVSGK